MLGLFYFFLFKPET